MTPSAATTTSTARLPARSEIRETLKGRTRALEDLAVELLARGLSVGDFADAFRDESGRLLLSRTAVSEIGERPWTDYQEFAGRDLFVGDVAERIRPGQKREPVLAARGFTETGAKVLLHLMPGSKEDAETVIVVLRACVAPPDAPDPLADGKHLALVRQRIEGRQVRPQHRPHRESRLRMVGIDD